MRTTIRRSGIVAVAAASALTLAACGSGAGAAPDSDGAVKTGEGVSGTTITLGVGTDMTGPFAPNGLEALEGMKLYWEELNAAGGVCDTYSVDLLIRDHESNPQQAVTIYQEMIPQIAAFQTFTSSGPVAAIAEDLLIDHRLTIANTATELAVDHEYILPIFGKYDLDGAISVQWLVETGAVKSGDTIASIYSESDYGKLENEGAKDAAEQHGLNIVEYQVKATDTDLSAAVSAALGEDVAAIFIGGSPGQTASIATSLQSAGAELPIAGAVAAFSASLLQTPVADYLTEHFTGTYYNVTGESGVGKELFEHLVDANDGKPVGADRANGYAMAVLAHQLLESACAAGDLTPEGIAAQRYEIGVTNLDGYSVDYDFSEPGVSGALTAFIRQPDASIPGGARTISDGAVGLDD